MEENPKANKVVDPKVVKKLEKEAKKKLKEAVKRQNAYEKLEICQNIPFVFGDVVPSKRKEICVIKEVSPLHIWMQPNYVFNTIKAIKSEEIFHDIKVYALKWQPPGSKYLVLIPLDDPQLQENMLIQLHNMSSRERNRVIFFFSPKNPSMNLFAPRVHPSSLISYRTNDQVLKKLCDFYLQGKISLQDLQNTLSGKYDLWRQAMYNLLPSDEQQYHKYLTESTEPVVTQKQAEKQYLDDSISLVEYGDLKFPERKIQRDLAALSYPRPYDTGECVVCSDPNAIIQCQNCSNLVCKPCIHRLFLNPETKEGSFLLIHRRYCLRLGKLTTVQPIIVNEPAYLRELRATGRTSALDKLAAIIESQRIHREEAEDDDGFDAEEAEEAERRRQLQLKQEQLAAAKKARECPPELEKLQENFKALMKKYGKIEKEILDYQSKLDESTHTEQFLSRIARLKQEEMEKLENSVRSKLKKLVKEVTHLQLEGNPSIELVEAAQDALEKVALLSAIECVEEFHIAVKMHILQKNLRNEEKLQKESFDAPPAMSEIDETNS